MWIYLNISDFFAEYLDFVFTMGGKITKSHRGAPPGPRGGAEAGERSEREKVKILSKKVRDTQANPSYSAKNNVAIRVIATFMPN